MTKNKSPSTNEGLVVFSDQVLVAGATAPVPAALEIENGKWKRVETGEKAFNRYSGQSKHPPIFDLSGQGVIAPGLVDVHAHINEPGRTEWEGFETATAACASGGTTCVVDMPLNSIPATVTKDAFRLKREAANGKCAVDYGLWGGIIPGGLSEIEPLIEAGVIGFKVFLVPSGVDEFPHVTREHLLEAMPILAKNGIPLIVHAELESAVSINDTTQGASKKYRTYLESRPAEWEVRAIRMMIELAEKTGCATHIVHLSAADALDDIARAKAKGLKFTAETCPHYLSISSEEIPDGATHFKCAPPIREKSNQDRLWEGLRTGVIDFVTSDHSPCTPVLKASESGDFGKAWGGIASLQFTLPLVWSGARAHGVSLSKVFEWLSSRPAQFAGMGSRKGAIAVGKDADFLLFQPEKKFTLTREMIRYKHQISPYIGRELFGPVRMTFLRGKPAFEASSTQPLPRGEWLGRQERI